MSPSYFYPGVMVPGMACLLRPLLPSVPSDSRGPSHLTASKGEALVWSLERRTQPKALRMGAPDAG